MPENYGERKVNLGRLKIGDRVRHIDSREGIVISIQDGDVVVDLEVGGTNISPEGYWEKIHRNKVTP